MVDKILEERGNRYGEFDEHARITQEIKEAMKSGCSWELCTDSQKEALEMIAHKIGRIVNGDPSYDDSWIDIIGYTQLVVNELKETKTNETENENTIRRILKSFDIHNNKINTMAFTRELLDNTIAKTEEVYPRNEYNHDNDIMVSILNKDRDYIVIHDNQNDTFSDKKLPGEFGKNLPTYNWSKTKKGE